MSFLFYSIDCVLSASLWYCQTMCVQEVKKLNNATTLRSKVRIESQFLFHLAIWSDMTMRETISIYLLLDVDFYFSIWICCFDSLFSSKTYVRHRKQQWPTNVRNLFWLVSRGDIDQTDFVVVVGWKEVFRLFSPSKQLFVSLSLPNRFVLHLKSTFCYEQCNSTYCC